MSETPECDHKGKGLAVMSWGPCCKGCGEPYQFDNQGPHPDEVAVERFAATMKDKLSLKRDEGRSGWENKDECSAEFLSRLLREHVEKGDPIDVANFAMMLHQRGERIIAPSKADKVSKVAPQTEDEIVENCLRMWFFNYDEEADHSGHRVAMRAIVDFVLAQSVDEARNASAKLVEDMLNEPSWSNNRHSRLALTVASRAIRRGRLLGSHEKWENIKAFCEEHGDD